ncbi:MTMRB protein, partial [Pomatorhinus ruficollis]|nr:MTMRB protein [Pomatorhinus ruficollis]
LTPASSFSKPKVLTATSTLKFIPEELAVFCRDFRLLHFYFPENGLAPQAFRVANAIAQAREAAAWLGDAAEGHDGWSSPGEAPPEEEEEQDEEEGLSTMLLFESLWDWEKELQRLGAAGWRVSAVNERFDMAPRYRPISPPTLSEPLQMAPVIWGTRPCVPPSHSLPQYLWLWRWCRCWQGSAAPWSCKVGGPGWGMEKDGGAWKGDAPLTTLPPPEPSDRDLNCLLASLVQLLGDPHARSLPGFQSLVQREWVAAGHPFPRRLGLLRRDTPREEAPVFLLFLDCTWQLLWQFPADFGFTEAFLLALHDSSFSPYFSTFRFSCQRQRGHSSMSQLPSQTYRPVGGWQDPGGHRRGPHTCTFPPVWAWGRRYSRQQQEQFRNPVGPPAPAESLAPGTPGDPCLWGGARLVLTLAKGSLCPHSLPWWSRPPLRPPQRVSPSESQGTQGGLLGTCHPPPGLLLPCTAGPCIRLWHRCYLRGLPQEQQRGRLAPSLDGLAEELELLQDRLRAWNMRRLHRDPRGHLTPAQ